MLSFVLATSLLLAVTHGYQMTRASRTLTTTHLRDMSKAVPFVNAPKNLEGLPGYKGFDPLGFSDIIDPKYLLEAEIKHCRIAMLAVVGWIATEFVKLPGEVHNVTPVEAHNAAVASGSLFQVLLLVVTLELFNVQAIKEMLEGSGRQPGEWGFDPLKFSAGKSDKVKADFANKEIENGRLAMLAFAGIVTQAVLTGKGFPYF